MKELNKAAALLLMFSALSCFDANNTTENTPLATYNYSIKLSNEDLFINILNAVKPVGYENIIISKNLLNYNDAKYINENILLGWMKNNGLTNKFSQNVFTQFDLQLEKLGNKSNIYFLNDDEYENKIMTSDKNGVVSFLVVKPVIFALDKTNGTGFMYFQLKESYNTHWEMHYIIFKLCESGLPGVIKGLKH